MITLDLINSVTIPCMFAAEQASQTSWSSCYRTLTGLASFTNRKPVTAMGGERKQVLFAMYRARNWIAIT